MFWYEKHPYVPKITPSYKTFTLRKTSSHLHLFKSKNNIEFNMKTLFFFTGQ